MEARKPWGDDRPCRDAQRVDAKRAAHPPRRLTGIRHCSSHLPEQRGDAPVEQFARCRGCDAARGAIQKAGADATFELADRLAQRRRRQAKMLCGSRKTLTLHDGNKGLEFSKVGSAHYVLVSKEPIRILGYSIN